MCTVPTKPCSIGAAAGGPDVLSTDEAVILPGRYSDADLDGDVTKPMDHTVDIEAGIVHGEPGDRPVITLSGSISSSNGAFVTHPGNTLSDVEDRHRGASVERHAHRWARQARPSG